MYNLNHTIVYILKAWKIKSLIEYKITTIRILKPLIWVEPEPSLDFNSDGSQLRKLHINGSCTFKKIPINSISFHVGKFEESFLTVI